MTATAATVVQGAKEVANNPRSESQNLLQWHRECWGSTPGHGSGTPEHLLHTAGANFSQVTWCSSKMSKQYTLALLWLATHQQGRPKANVANAVTLGPALRGGAALVQ